MTDANGLYYMRARYYDPKLKRFLNRDVIRGEIQDGQTFNRYAYVNGNPVSYIDPLGLSKWETKSEGASKGDVPRIPSDEELLSSVSEWSNMQKSIAPSNRKRDLFNTATLAYDAKTGNYYYGMNKGVDLSGDVKNTVLFGNKNQVGILPKNSLNDYKVGNCSEVDAINQALNQNAKLNDLYLVTIETTRSSFGKTRLACENCTSTFKGTVADAITGWTKGEK
ncbi:RHS repeat-associated core domain-containing protein [Paenibacillus sp. UASWS1643]|uniref:RHS repeat-associated core domain-containing protein n=1 Tax=Paenibacillus sp. UASWS1643 TaxID=2580422 RepID=UPI00123B9B64|nr:RHS repeat-associated core domain-containing protein [Paenibacillus sp. UASWS1643]